MKISLVVPCYNEQDNIAEFYRVATKTFISAPYDYELIFVNDGSKDKTLDILTKIYESDNVHVNVVSFSRNFGKEAAIYAGLKNVKGDIVTIIDADLQQRPELAKDMVEYLIEHPEYDCVAAYQKERHESIILRLFKKIFYKLINMVSEVEFQAGASDFRTMRKCMVDALLSLPEYYRFSKGLFSWVGFDTYYMPYIAEKRFSGDSKWSFRSLFKYAINGIVAFTVSPLKIATYIGSVFSILSIIYMIVVIIQKLFFSIDIPGYPTLICLILFLGGLQLIILGIIGEYLSRMYIEGKRRPIYIEKIKLDAITKKEEIDQHSETES